MGITPADLLTTTAPTPTFAEVIPKVRAALTDGTARTYGTHFDLMLREWPNRRLDEPTATELRDMAAAIQKTARTNRASRGGTSAAVHFVSAVRSVYKHAEDNGWIGKAENPARKVPVPARNHSQRYAIPSHQIAQICEIAATTGNDPELDSLILRLIHTAFRGVTIAISSGAADSGHDGWRRPRRSR
ncbi:hypothetical protein [Nocardia sp. BMG51109]|uniref:hypothetical protein n=1 Tax=Nocardia sp. BMG51109 TaxID=1056816 RepID=UPI0012ECA929|nr:hypothetical protein [Nocardia sp. BMG51109]